MNLPDAAFFAENRDRIEHHFKARLFSLEKTPDAAKLFSIEKARDGCVELVPFQRVVRHPGNVRVQGRDCATHERNCLIIFQNVEINSTKTESAKTTERERRRMFV